MTDKQIIIDGIDVSGCEHYDEVCLGNHHYKWCKDNDNCYYKQLKRKEQECERLKHDNGYEVGALERTIDNLKAENDKLKKNYFTVIQQRNKAEKTLTEIKEIAENVIKNVSDRCIETTPMYGVHKQILQKISEVVDG